MPTELEGSPTFTNPIPAPADGEPVTGDSVQQMGRPLINNDEWFRSILEGMGLGAYDTSAGWSDLQLPLNPDNSDLPWGAFLGVAELGGRTELIAQRVPGFSNNSLMFEVPIMQALTDNTGWTYSFSVGGNLQWVQTTYSSNNPILIPLYNMPREGVILGVDCLIDGQGWDPLPDSMPTVFLLRTNGTTGSNLVVLSQTDTTANAAAFNLPHFVQAAGTHNIVTNSTYYILLTGVAPAQIDATLRLYRARVYYKRA